MNNPNPIPNDTTATLEAIAYNDGGEALLLIACDSLDIYPQQTVEDYSGRGMLGRECTAIVLETRQEAEAVALQVSRLSGKAGKRIGASIDSLGRSFVVYCPSRVYLA